MSNGTFQQVIIIGNACADAEVKFTNSGTAVCTLSVATSKSWRDKNSGEKREKTEFHRVQIWGKTAEIAGEYVRKGQKLHIVGELETRKWQTQDGQDRYTTEVVVQGFNGVMQMLGGKSQPQSNAPTPPNQPPSKLQQPSQPQWPTNNEPNNSGRPQYNEPPMDFPDDDIPFGYVGISDRKLINCM